MSSCMAVGRRREGRYERGQRRMQGERGREKRSLRRRAAVARTESEGQAGSTKERDQGRTLLVRTAGHLGEDGRWMRGWVGRPEARAVGARKREGRGEDDGTRESQAGSWGS